MAEAPNDLNLASARLEKAIAALEGRVKTMGAKSKSDEGLFKSGDGGAREKALEAAAREASAALGRAAQEMRVVLEASAAQGGGED